MTKIKIEKLVVENQKVTANAKEEKEESKRNETLIRLL